MKKSKLRVVYLPPDKAGIREQVDAIIEAGNVRGREWRNYAGHLSTGELVSLGVLETCTALKKRLGLAQHTLQEWNIGREESKWV